jgi:hypothetical protein
MTDTVTTYTTDTATHRGATSLRATRRARARRGFAALSVRVAGTPGTCHGFSGSANYQEIL